MSKTLSGIRWSVQDREGRVVYITEERWQHIVEPTAHPEMEEHEEELKQTIQHGQRKQDVLNPKKFRYSKAFDGLTDGNTHIVAIVLFSFRETHEGIVAPNNYMVTAYQKVIG